jgi:hypothetical protein
MVSAEQGLDYSGAGGPRQIPHLAMYYLHIINGNVSV